MLPNVLNDRGGERFSVFIYCALVIFLFSFDCTAQSRSSGRRVLPRVGTIKDYPATGLMTGCGNLYFYPASKPSVTDASYVFLARGDGDDAWMNLNGRDVRLQQVKSLISGNRKLHRYYYRLGKLRITVVFENFKPDGAPIDEADSMFKMTITLRQGNAVRSVKAVGDSDC